MKYIYIVVVSLLLISCGDEEVKQSTDAKLEKPTKPLKEEQESNQEELKTFKSLPQDLGYEVTLIDKEVFEKAKENNIELTPDTSDFKKIGKNLYIYVDSIKVFEIQDKGNIEFPSDRESYSFVPMGYYLINQQRWYIIQKGYYEGAEYILLPPPYSKTYTMGRPIAINPEGSYLFDLFFTGLYEFQGKWDLFKIKDNQLVDVSSFKLDCGCANKESSNLKASPLCAQIEGEVKWISENELLAKVRNYESMNENKVGYIKIKIK